MSAPARAAKAERSMPALHPCDRDFPAHYRRGDGRFLARLLPARALGPASALCRMNSTNAGPFQDQSLPFFFLHAKLWLLISISRIAIDSPQLIAPYTAQLESITRDTAFPHVLFHHFGSLALVQTARTITGTNKDELLQTLSTVNVSPWPQEDQSRHSNSRGHASNESRTMDSADKFYFDVK